VVDQGIGIDPTQLEAVFGLFEQQGRGLDRAQGGLGLGLAIVRNLITQHGGGVRAYSDGHGHGSRFVVTLPPLSHPVPTAAATQPGEARAAPLHGNILLVDDNADAAATLAMGLRLVGFEVRTAADGPTALTLVAEWVPDVALLDIGLPVMDGYELAGLLRARCGPSIRLIALTGYGQRSDRIRAAAAGFDAHLDKPVEFSEVLATLERVLDLHTSAES
jgi:CheY-like chemotaxis protein